MIRYIDDLAIAKGRVDIVTDGQELLPKEDGFILYPNHQGMFDVLAIMKTTDRRFCAVFKKELANIPFLKQIIRLWDAIPLDRSDPREGLKVILEMADRVKKGENFLIFAEGTRSRKGNELLEFKGGSFKAATKAKCPIVPVALIDSFKAFDTGSAEKMTMHVHYLQPILWEEYQGMKTPEIAAMVKARIEAKIAEITSGESDTESE